MLFLRFLSFLGTAACVGLAIYDSRKGLEPSVPCLTLIFQVICVLKQVGKNLLIFMQKKSKFIYWERFLPPEFNETNHFYEKSYLTSKDHHVKKLLK